MAPRKTLFRPYRALPRPAREHRSHRLSPRPASSYGESQAKSRNTPHYDGYPVVLVDLDKIDQAELRELITDSWLIKAPPKLRRQFEGQ